MFDILLLVHSSRWLEGWDNRGRFLLSMLALMTPLGVRPRAHAACLERRHALFDGAAANASDLVKVAAILVECSFEVRAAGCVGFMGALLMFVGFIVRSCIEVNSHSPKRC
jgi:hypothetical protein